MKGGGVAALEGWRSRACAGCAPDVGVADLCIMTNGTKNFFEVKNGLILKHCKS